jgi:hypothetical protein
MVSRFDHSLLEPVVILDDSVVNDGDAPGLVEVRVRILVGRRAMRGPAGVPQAQSAMERAAFQQARKAIVDLALLLVQLEGAAMQNGDASAVVASVLEAAQAFENDRPGLAFSQISNNSAHKMVYRTPIDLLNPPKGARK